mgnify:CR=1 FL=1
MNNNMENNVQMNIPANYKPLSAWAYFGYQILFAIPLIGFIFLLVFSFSNENINRRNFARSYFCSLLLVVIVTVIFTIMGLALGMTNS